MVYKQYKAGALASLNVDALEAMPEFLESLPYRDGAKLISLGAWPCAIVDDAGKTTGFVMPSIPDEFFTDFWTSNQSTPSKVAAEFQHLLNDPRVLAMRFAGWVVSDRQRYELLQQAASALAFLHERGVCVGDISPKNMLFSLSPYPAVYFIDCDAMRVSGVSLSHQVETPGWEVPAGEEKATVYSDRYKLGLLALRLIVGSQDAKDPSRIPSSTPAELSKVITDTLTNTAQQRPDLATWDRALAKAIAAPPRPTPSTTVTITPATATAPPTAAAPGKAAATRRSGPLLAALVTPILALVAGAGLLGWQVWQQNQLSKQRDEVQRSAVSFAHILTSIDSNNVDETFRQVLNGATGEFKDMYSQSSAELRQMLLENKAHATSVVVDSAVQSASKDKAVVLLFIDQTVTNTKVPEPRLDRSRMKMTLEVVDGSWRASKVELP
jgi:DNA-binding helix-hairpin-helix protein with protein kinase domain